MTKSDDAKKLYAALRRLPWPRLWGQEVARFNAASADERAKRVAVIRAVGVVCAESGATREKEKVRAWLLGLLQDPSEKVRRYAMSAMPKIGAGAEEEAMLLSRLAAATEERERKFLARTLGKIGGTAALEHSGLGDAEQKIKAGLARQKGPSAILMRAVLTDFSGLQIHLHGRRGLERIVSEEVEQTQRVHGKFHVTEIYDGDVAVIPCASFSLSDVYAMRCFGAAAFVLGQTEKNDTTTSIEALAELITSPLSRRLLQTFTAGAIRYRLNFAGLGHQRAAVARLANRVYARCPEILNDGRKVTWTVDIHANGRGHRVELRPNMTPDPRFSYRQKDVPAASHPPLAACLARLAGVFENDVVWDPFCGSGLELIERALLGGVRSVLGSDQSAGAVAIARTNYSASPAKSVPASFVRGDFRDIAQNQFRGSGKVSLIITNPPLGRRVPVPGLHRLIEDLFRVAATVLVPGGRLVFVNPLAAQTSHSGFKLQFQQSVDMGGFACHLEKYVKVAS